MIDRRVGLDVVVERTFRDVAVDGADDTGGDAFIEAKRSADGNDGVTDPHLVAVAEADERQWFSRIYLQ